MRMNVAVPDAKGISLIELIIAMAIAGIIIALVAPAYSSYRTRTHRLNGESCLLDLQSRQESYFSRRNHYAADLRALGYTATASVECKTTDQYRLALLPADAKSCPLEHCYRAVAVPQGSQSEDGFLYLSYDASQMEPDHRMKTERGTLGSGTPWD